MGGRGEEREYLEESTKRSMAKTWLCIRTTASRNWSIMNNIENREITEKENLELTNLVAQICLSIYASSTEFGLFESAIAD